MGSPVSAVIANLYMEYLQVHCPAGTEPGGREDHFTKAFMGVIVILAPSSILPLQPGLLWKTTERGRRRDC